MGKKKIRINFFSRLQSKKSTPPSLDGGILNCYNNYQYLYINKTYHGCFLATFTNNLTSVSAKIKLNPGMGLHFLKTEFFIKTSITS